MKLGPIARKIRWVLTDLDRTRTRDNTSYRYCVCIGYSNTVKNWINGPVGKGEKQMMYILEIRESICICLGFLPYLISIFATWGMKKSWKEYREYWEYDKLTGAQWLVGFIFYLIVNLAVVAYTILWLKIRMCLARQLAYNGGFPQEIRLWTTPATITLGVSSCGLRAIITSSRPTST